MGLVMVAGGANPKGMWWWHVALTMRVQGCGLAAGAHGGFLLFLNLEETVGTGEVIGRVRLVPCLVLSLWSCESFVCGSGDWDGIVVDL